MSSASSTLLRATAPVVAKKGDAVYVDHADHVFSAGVVQSSNKKQATVKTEHGEKRVVPTEAYYVVPQQLAAKLRIGKAAAAHVDDSFCGVDDMVHLQHLHEPSVLHNLEMRFDGHKIYTFIGSVLVSVNPYRNVPIYTPAVTRMYQGQPVGALPAHLFAVADSAYQASRGRARKNQSILISGESGAGKTEATKLVLGYLTAVSGGDGAVQERVLCTNPILEAFGNAKTQRNDNSSRFAKMISVAFGDSGTITGGHLRAYMLEKVRVVKQAKHERNFHVFYYLIAGCDKTERAVWGLQADAKSYKLVSQTRVYEIKGVNSKLRYVALKRAMTVGGISVHKQHLIFTTLAAMLHLGNVRFVGEDDGAEQGDAVVRNAEVVKWVSHLLKCDKDKLTEALLTRVVDVGGEAVPMNVGVKQATQNRNVILQDLYERLFHDIVSDLNTDMAPPQDRANASAILLLDIFGFEHYENNAFEQFCINFANEKLQHVFNEFIFAREKAAYAKQKINVENFVFTDNSATLQLIEVDVLRALDGPAGSMVKRIKASKLYVKERETDADQFAIRHYAGQVVYSIATFASHNHSHLSATMLDAMRSSKIELVTRLFDDRDRSRVPGEQEDEEKKQQQQNGGATISRSYALSLNSLMDELSATMPQYVRCLRPNASQSDKEFDRRMMLRQLRASGIVDTIRIRKEGFPFRSKMEVFLARYQVLSSAKLKGKLSAQTKALLAALKVDPDNFRIGTTKVFLKDDVHHHLEGLRFRYYNSAAVVIQANLKGFVARTKMKRKLEAARTLQFWIVQYLKAVDVSDQVEAHLASLSSKTSDRLGAVTALGQLARRGANVDTIAAKGGVNALLSAVGNDEEKGDVVVAGSHALATMAGRSAKHSVNIARSGGVVSSVKNIRNRGSTDGAASADLLRQLAKEGKNVGLVFREGGLDALIQALVRNSLATGEKDAAAVAAALGSLSEDKRASLAMGRDGDAIKAVIEGVNQKPMFARLTEYSINCLANMAQRRENLDSIVEHGGIQMLAAALANHASNENVLREIARLVTALAQNPMYAKMLGDAGMLGLALDALREDPEHCGEPACEIVQALCAHPANTTRLLRNNGIETFLVLMRNDLKVQGVQTIVMKVLAALCRDETNALEVVQLGGAEAVLASMHANPKWAEHNKHGLAVLLNIWEHDQSMGNIVEDVAQVMERHAEDQSVVDMGVSLLRVVATQEDLQDAMDFVARSRMKDQTKKLLAETAVKVMVVGSMALIEGNVDYIVREGGIAILLAIVNGSKLVRVVVPTIRALARLMVDDDHVEMLREEGGIETLVAAIQDKERVCLVSLLAFRTLHAHLDQEVIVQMIRKSYRFESVAISAFDLLTVMKRRGVPLRVVLKAMRHHKHSAATLIAAAKLLTVNGGAKRQRQLCAEVLLLAMKESPENAELAVAVLRFLATIKELKQAAPVVLLVLNEHYHNAEVASLAARVLSNITSKTDLEAALEQIRTCEIGDMLPPVTLVGSMAASPKAAGEISEAGGFKVLKGAIKRVQRAPESQEQEQLLKFLAVAVTRLSSHRENVKTLLVSGTIDHLLSAATHYVDYEEFVEEAQATLDVVSRNPEATAYLIDIGAHKSAASIVHAHPLNDEVLVQSTRFVTRLAKGADMKHLETVREEGANLAISAVGRFMNSEDHLIDALSSVAQIANVRHDGGSVAIAHEQMHVFSEVIQKHGNSPSVMTAAAAAFGALAANDQFAEFLISGEIVMAIVRALEAFGDHAEFVAKAFGALSRVKKGGMGSGMSPELVLELIGRHLKEEDVVLQGLRLLEVMGVEDIAAARLAFDAIRSHPSSQAIVLASLRVAVQHELEEEDADMIEWAMRAYPENAELQVLCKKLLKAPVMAVPRREVEQKDSHHLLALMKIIKDPEMVHKKLSVALMALANSRAPDDALSEVIKHGGMSRLITILDEKAGDTTVLVAVLKCLIRFADKGEHVNMIVMYGGIGALIRAIKMHMDKPNVLATAMILLGKLSVYTRLKILIGLHGGVPVVLQVIEAYLSLGPLVNKCFYVVGNLAMSLPSRKVMIGSLNAVSLLCFGLTRHRNYLELVVNAARALAPLCVGDDPSCLAVCQGGASMIVISTIVHNALNPKVLRTGLHLLHKLSGTARCLSLLIHQGAMRGVCSAMRAHEHNEPLVEYSMTVLCALSAAARSSSQMAALLTEDGTIETVITSALNHHRNQRAQASAFKFLENVGRTDSTLSVVIVQSGFVTSLVDSLAAPEASDDVLLDGTRLLTVLATHCADDIVQSEAVDVLLILIRTRADLRDLTKQCLICLTKLSTTKDHASQLASRRCVAAVVECLLDSSSDDHLGVLREAMRLATNLAIFEDNALTLAELATEPLIRALDRFFADRLFLTTFLQLLGNLSTWPQAARVLIDNDIVPILVDSIKVSMRYPNVLVRILRVMTQLLLLGEYAKRVLIDAIMPAEECLIQHSGHTQVVKAAEFFLYKMKGATRSSKLSLAIDLATYVKQKLPDELINLIRGGALFWVHLDSGSPKKRYVKVSPDFTTISLRDPKKKGDEFGLPVRFLKKVLPGACTQRLRSKNFWSARRAEPECSFALFDLREPDWDLSLESDSAREALDWVTALQLLREAYVDYSVGL